MGMLYPHQWPNTLQPEPRKVAFLLKFCTWQNDGASHPKCADYIQMWHFPLIDILSIIPRFLTLHVLAHFSALAIKFLFIRSSLQNAKVKLWCSMQILWSSQVKLQKFKTIQGALQHSPWTIIKKCIVMYSNVKFTMCYIKSKLCSQY